MCWQGRAGITQRTLVLLLIQFYVSLQTDMNVAIQQRIRAESKQRKLKSVCVFGQVNIGHCTLPVSGQVCVCVFKWRR